MLGQGDPFACGFWVAQVGEALPATGDDDLAPALPDLDAFADPVCGHGVAIGIDGDVGVDVDDALVEQVGLGDPDGKRSQLGTLDVVELDR